MSESGKVRVIVRSQRIPVRVFEFQQPVYSQSGIRLGSETKRKIIYDTELDAQYLAAIGEARKLSCNLGLELEVVDKGRSGLLGRFITSLTSRRSRGPILVVTAPSVSATSITAEFIPTVR